MVAALIECLVDWYGTTVTRHALRCGTVHISGYTVHQQPAASIPGIPEPTITVYHQPTLCSFQGIGSGQRQLIAVTCIAEHA